MIKLLIFVFVTFFSILSYAQNITVNYQCEFVAVPKPTNDFTPDEEMYASRASKLLKNTVEQIQIDLNSDEKGRFVLKINPGIKTDNSFSANVGLSLLNLHSILYGQDKQRIFGFDQKDRYLVEYSNLNVDWEITSESKSILGFKCFKAIPKYLNIEGEALKGLPLFVWFAPKINRNGGPLKYNGLPGLVLEVESDLVRIKAFQIADTDDIISMPEVTKEKVSETEYYEILRQNNEAIRKRRQ